MNTTEAAKSVQDYERNTFCTTEYHQHSLSSLIYTDGIHHLAETCGAYWLIDLVASHQPAIHRKLQQLGLRDFQVWKIEQQGDRWQVSAWSDTPGLEADENGPGAWLLASQTLTFTTFPPELSGYEWWVENGTMLMKAER